MTRLFLRFYIGVIIILIIAWQVNGYLFQTRSASQNRRVVENALAGGARLAKGRLESVPLSQAEAEFRKIEDEFEHPIRVVPLGERPMGQDDRTRLLAGDVVLLYGSVLEIALGDGNLLLELGPLPQFVVPSQTELTVAVGGIFALAAIAIAILLRPVANQLRAVEKTATAIAQGDLSARIDMSRSIRKLPLASAFNSMADRTESLLQSQRELLQAVSHELRTPLARIQFATEMIRGSKSDQDREQRLESVDKATEELDRLVGELLAYVRLDSGSIDRSAEAININELIDEQCDTFGSMTPKVAFTKQYDSEAHPVFADPKSISRAIGNLLANASRYAVSEIRISTHYRDKSTLIVVEDDGPGIPEQDRQKILNPFVTLDDSNPGGAGLGLALVQRIVNQLDGTIEVSQSDLGGAKFEIRIPRDSH